MNYTSFLNTWFRGMSLAAVIGCFFSQNALAQTVSFDSLDYKAIGVYDTWEQSPFRNGAVKLEGNVKVVDNCYDEPDPITGMPINDSKYILGFQRSRFASNTFGARIDLNEPFALTPTKIYVHAFIRKPFEGRSMVVCLGKRPERYDQSPETEQVWSISTNTITTNEWVDAVFPINSCNGVEIHSLVIVPDCESPHNLTEDYACFIDQIEVNSSPSPRIQHGNYVVNDGKDAQLTRTDRYIRSISFSSPSAGEQKMSVPQNTDKLLYHNFTSTTWYAKPGETITPAFSYYAKASTSAQDKEMNGYVYFDKGNDGVFNVDNCQPGVTPDDADIMAYSYYKGKDSKGATATGNELNPPTFTIPDNFPCGLYRVRYKIDWNCLDAGGNTDASSGIVSNGGSITDIMLNIHADSCMVNDANRNGEVLAADSSKLSGYKAAFGEPFIILMHPENGFTYEGVRVRHGYNLSGNDTIHDNPQYREVIYPSYAFRNDKLTLPAEIMDGDVEIEGLFIEVKPTPIQEDYPVNFKKELTASHKRAVVTKVGLSRSISGSKTISISKGNQANVYVDLCPNQISVKIGEKINPLLTVSGGTGMNAYFFIDLNQDGQFNNSIDKSGLPTMSGELVSYSYYKGFNSLGEKVDSSATITKLPVFTIPEYLPEGIYRARVKLDVNNIEPSKLDSSLIDEATANPVDGYIVDFLLNVYSGEAKPVILVTKNGNIFNTTNTAIPTTFAPFTSNLTVYPTPICEGYETEGLVIRHGHNIFGPQYVHGNRQWSEYTKTDSKVTIVKDSINVELMLSAFFEPTESAQFLPLFEDEFNAEALQPDSSIWSPILRGKDSSTRFSSSSPSVIQQKEGYLVCRGIPNPDMVADSAVMLTGGVFSSVFAFQYGKIEVRALFKPYKGNAPYISLVGANIKQTSWPTCGELNLFTGKNDENKAYQGVMSNWVTTLGQISPTAQLATNVADGRYHTYGLEWNDSLLTWFVDGKKTLTYAKSTDSEALINGQWPFDQPCFIVINQALAEDGTTTGPVKTHEYELSIDWVRVYKPSEITSVTDLNETTFISSEYVYDLSGRKLNALPATRGIYIQNGQKVAIE